ncbi:hypothetical protein JTB14_006262 [Gonioctena quinquepunctata]|nr:hypothetical protein JTB14_006262 [Gonioctena quinquepunctata]
MQLRSLDEEGVQNELANIKSYLRFNEEGHIWDILSDKILRKAFIICLILITTQELSGFCAIMYHLQMIFESAGTNIRSDISAMIVGLMLVISSFIAPFLVDRAGRRSLIIYSCMGMCVPLAMLGGFFYIQDVLNSCTSSIFWVPIFSLIVYIIFFNLGICTVPWTLTAELFPNNVRQIAVSAVCSFCWVTSFTTTKTFNDMNRWMGQSGTFWFFSMSCLCCAIFSKIFVPETKGKSFSEIQEMLMPNVKFKNNLEEDKTALREVEKGCSYTNVI